ncbi:MAG: GNAT family N-acetyltransferase [Kibdelosporangium sp.]
MSQPTFETNRLSLRPMRADDRDAVVKVFADRESSRYLTRDMSDPANAAASFERWLGWGSPGGMGTWLFDLNGAVIGVGRFTPSTRLPGGLIEAGWFVARGHAGHGYASEALRTLLDYGMRTLSLPAIWAVIYAGNEPSFRLAQGLGFLDMADFYQPAGPARVFVLLPATPPATPPQPTLRTERLVIRPLRESDRSDVRDVFSDASLVRYLSSDAQQPGWIDSMIDHRLGYNGPAGMGHWAFIEDDTLVGIGHLRPSWELPGGVAEIGWYLGRDHQGRGLATEAAAALLSHGLYTLRVPSVWALVHKANKASLRLTERLGFLDVGTGQHYGDPHRVHVALPKSVTH